MTSNHGPEDQPFNPEDVVRANSSAGHNRASSSATLLHDEGVKGEDMFPGYSPQYPDAGYNYTHYGGPSEYNLVDKQEFNNPKLHDLEYSDPYDETRARPMSEQPSTMAKFLGPRQYPISQRIDDKKRGVTRQRYPIVVWTLSAVMLGVFIYELVLNAKNQGSPLSFKPVVNPMLGPSSSALINAGARFPPCMKSVQGLLPSTPFLCLNSTSTDQSCPLEEVCGFGGFHDKEPNQWWRFITPIFLHAGIIHFLLNMLAQLTASAEVEREMGSAGFFILYFATGIFGNVLGGNFSLVGVPSVGASGAIFGTVAVAWIDLFAHWKYQYKPVRRLVIMIVELVIGIAIGFIPYVDNFAHIGGFLMGILCGMALYPIISASKRHRIITWTLRLAAIPLAVVLFVVLIRNFYKSDPYAACSWCRYLSCIPTSANNHCKGYVVTFVLYVCYVTMPLFQNWLFFVAQQLGHNYMIVSGETVTRK
ncbi:rhomboid-domain-containing protein [Panus rudis PR-1116 ss-1]|nr:rhomboid-domain-containing protein [Panus rudis PR-1116 ss-1]